MKYEKEFLFVYGTLMRTHNHAMSDFLQRHSTFWANGYFYGKLYDLGKYPGAILSLNNEDKVYGQIFQLNNANAVLPPLDRYEGVGEDVYSREKINAITETGERLECWVYLYCKAVNHHIYIASGNYHAYLLGR